MTDKTGKLKPPSNDHPDDKVRALVEAGIDLVPLGSSVSRLASELFPKQAEMQRRQWEGEITDRTNEHAGRLDEHDSIISPKTTVTGVGAKLIVALAQAPGDGMAGRGRDLDEIAKLLPAEDKQGIEDAVFDLEQLGLVTLQRAIGKHWWLQLTPVFYEQIDHQVMGWDTRSDAVTLANLLLADDTRGHTAELHKASGWDKRRFNPAFQILADHVPQGLVSREIQPHYPSSSIVMTPDVRASLRRFVSASNG